MVLASLLTCAGQLCQSKRPVRRKPGGVVPILCSGWGSFLLALGCGMLVWLVVLQRFLPSGVAYPMLSLNFVWVTLAAKGLWHEKVALTSLAGRRG